MKHILDVYLHGLKAGILVQDESGVLSFTYGEGYLESEQHALSISLPLSDKTNISHNVKAFFSGLLPDEIVRHRLAKYLGVSEKNPFALLEAIGGECAGALSLVPRGAEVEATSDETDELLNEDRLVGILELLRRRPMLAGDDGLRLSLAGAQDKIAVGVSGDNIVLVKGNRPTSHILKPLIEGVEDSVHNEVFCMRLASKMGIDAPHAEIRYAAGVPYFLVERYDRKLLDGGMIKRIHQEDFCQALGIMPEVKYEREGGPNMAACMELIKAKAMRPALDQTRLLERVIFNYLIGNSDAHGKNFSLLYRNSKPDLSPAYDLLSTAIYPDLSAKMAMKIGEKYKPGDVFSRHWQKLVPDSAAAKRNLTKVLTEMCEKVRVHSRELVAELEGEGEPSKIYNKIIAVIDSRIKHIHDHGL